MLKIKSHLPAGTRCCDRKITPEVRMMSQKFNNNNTNSRKQSKSSLQHHPISSPYLQQLNDQGPSSNFPKQNTQKSNARPVLSLPKANQRWPPGNQTSHVVPPPPNQPAPADQPASLYKICFII
ncbi:hypothetical protein Anas_07680 [Armadillidium nasatum]|uniref:Uncharacterized protein n=1 Tax=Armadillidium nasatum TaxID=96803 RepID=A0A5N5SJT2_9CRUS|nr:hypothetical protein Anas_07680 [Armadillidium nasatum]